MRIVQIAPHVGPGTGVGAVAFHLEREWKAAGHDVTRFTLVEARGGWIPTGLTGIAEKGALAARVLWFSTVGTVLARRHLASSPPGTIIVCHNDVLAGDVYVNHGNLVAAMQARGHAWYRLLRNPLHLFTTTRDCLRYRSRVHSAVVNLSSVEDDLLRTTFGSVGSTTWVIPNGVDLDVYRPPSEIERSEVRATLRLQEDDNAVLFVGHEFGRKGLLSLVEALLLLPPHHHLVVVGGDQKALAQLRNDERVARLGDRCHLVGATSPAAYYWASDVLVQPSAYESYGLVVTEALASGLPVISTPVGCAPDVIDPGHNGYLTTGSPHDIARRIQDVELLPAPGCRRAAREAVQSLTWAEVAKAYLTRMASLQTGSTV
ncbi:glycosyltransferase family 4 protein [Ornithinimicrobium cerasi]|uniref:glycosyltransferase family 4 protein n=1 Tax=Ornithinimicrobium cerasi TaxID=2248773 RepID=UPI000F00AA4C|nr:glycosyltransferase family 4 protein [Ornithinimicrobium cerasi]